MGEVWRVADRLDWRAEKALKVIKVDGAPTEAQRERFMAEYRAMAGLRHPNTVEVHAWGYLPDGAPFLVMDLVPGQELAELAAAGPIPAAQVYPLLIQLVQALDFVHSRGYVYRDIKAANVRVTPDGTLKLMDFGLMIRPDPEAMRQPVMLRKKSQGTRSEKGKKTLGTLLSVVETCRRQARAVINFREVAIRNHRVGLPPLSLVPA